MHYLESRIKKLNLNELEKLEFLIKIEKKDRTSFENSLKKIKDEEKYQRELIIKHKSKIEDLKTFEQKEIERLGFSLIFDETEIISIINYNFKYQEKYKYYCINYNTRTKVLKKSIKEVTDDDMNKISKILDCKIEEY